MEQFLTDAALPATLVKTQTCLFVQATNDKDITQTDWVNDKHNRRDYMPDKWLQIKGDPSIRAFVFEQSRVEGAFDADLDRVHLIAHTLLTTKGAFHVKLHYSSGQLTCWFVDDVYRYRVYVKEEVLAPDFLDQFRDCGMRHLQPLIQGDEVYEVLNEFKRLRLTDKNIYMRNGSINRINGMIGMTFSCDGSHYIDHKTFFRQLENFGTQDNKEYTGPELARVANG
jgi:hypothetical protein